MQVFREHFQNRQQKISGEKSTNQIRLYFLEQKESILIKRMQKIRETEIDIQTYFPIN